MKKFNVWFKFVGGDSESFDLEAEEYTDITTQITAADNGWFGIKGKLINLNNVTRVEITEASKETYKSIGFS